MKQNIFVYLFLAVSLISCKTTKQKTTQAEVDQKNQNEINFEWVSLELDGVTYEHAAMLLPVYLDTVDKEFKMQFDLGANMSLIYEYPLNTILSEYPYLKDKVKRGEDYDVIKTSTKIDNYMSSLDELAIREEYGEDTTFNDLSLIGTIGANEIENKILIIDFENTTLTILNDSTGLDKSHYDFASLEYKYGKIFLPLTINNKTHKYMYDTGASIAPIGTIDKDFFNEVNNHSTELDSMKLESWGQELAFLKAEIKTPVQIGGISIKADNKNILYTEAEPLVQTFDQVGVKGLIGNDFFIDKVIVIDLMNNKFGVSKE